MRASLACALTASAVLASGCMPTSPAFDYAIGPDPVVDVTGADIVLAEGTSVVIVPYLWESGFEDSTRKAVDDIRSDDPTIAGLAFSTRLHHVPQSRDTRGVIVIGLRPGTTRLRLIDGGDDEGTLSVRVVEQTP